MVLTQFLKYLPDPPLLGIDAYSIEKKEWLMLIVFIIWVLSYTYLLMSLRFRIRHFRKKISIAILLISSLGLIIASILNIDPMSPPKINSRQINHKLLKPTPYERHSRCP